jgi:hypothetical protein
VAASALGIARASIELLKDLLSRQGVTAGWLLTLKAVWLRDQRRPNTIEASACKVRRATSSRKRRSTISSKEPVSSIDFPGSSRFVFWWATSPVESTSTILPNTRHIAIEHASHSFAGLTGCIDKVMSAFVIDPNPKAVDASCAGKLMMPAFK